MSTGENIESTWTGKRKCNNSADCFISSVSESLEFSGVPGIHLFPHFTVPRSLSLCCMARNREKVLMLKLLDISTFSGGTFLKNL